MTIYWIDAFTSVPFKGNPAAVCPTQSPLDEQLMRSLAVEINLSETAFFHPEGDGYRLRWFTPTTEIELCGHATLASAYVLYRHLGYSADRSVRFHTLSGELTVSLHKGKLAMQFPRHEVKPELIFEKLSHALGVVPVFVGKTPFDYIIEIESDEQLRQCAPDLSLLEQVDCRGVIVTSRDHTGKYDFMSRFFAPQSGIAEDPVTGSTHSALTPYWSRKLGKSQLTAYQASKRGGELWLEDTGSEVMISGECTEVMTAELSND